MSYRYEEEAEEDEEEEENNDEAVWQPALINRAQQRNLMILNHCQGNFVPIAFDDLGLRMYGPIIFSARIRHNFNRRNILLNLRRPILGTLRNRNRNPSFLFMQENNEFSRFLIQNFGLGTNLLSENINVDFHRYQDIDSVRSNLMITYNQTEVLITVNVHDPNFQNQGYTDFTLNNFEDIHVQHMYNF